jgi:hypothetical protein
MVQLLLAFFPCSTFPDIKSPDKYKISHFCDFDHDQLLSKIAVIIIKRRRRAL